MTPSRLEELRQIVGGIDGPKSAWLDELISEVDRLNLRCRGFQVMARKMLDQCLWEPMMEEGKYERAGGDVECHTCRLLYCEHPELPKYPTFHMLCSGAIVKT